MLILFVSLPHEKAILFAIIFGFVANLFGVFWPKKPFFIIGEEEDFLESLFLFRDNIIDKPCWSLMSRFRSLLTFGCVLLLLDHVVFLNWSDQLGRLNENRFFYVVTCCDIFASWYIIFSWQTWLFFSLLENSETFLNCTLTEPLSHWMLSEGRISTL